MDSRPAFSDSNEFSNGSITSCLEPYSTTNNPSADNIVSPDAFAPPDFAALQRLSENLESIFDSNEFNLYADAKIALESGEEVFVHRCIIAARSPYLKKVFAFCKERDGHGVSLQLKDLAGNFRVGFDALVTVLAYLYSGKVKPLPGDVCVCVDGECSHVGCRPAVDFMVEILYLAFTFEITELVSLYQRRLLEVLEKITPDDLLVVLRVANFCESECQRLHTRCVDIVVQSNVDSVALEKSLPMHIAKLIMDERKLRNELGLISLEDDGFPDKHVKRIHRALDSDDIELVKMLLNEGHTTLDDAYALHYAVAYCDAKTTSELLELGSADVNCKDLRGFSVLHVAAMRMEPVIIMSLLTKGASPTDVTLDGRNALQISERLTKAADWNKSLEDGKPSHKGRICIEILQKARRGTMFLEEASLSHAREGGDDLRSTLLYFESRVALARILFPVEAKTAMGTAQVDGTIEFTSKDIVDLNVPFIFKEEHHQRIRALKNTVNLGKWYFPRCSQEVDKIMDMDDLMDIVNTGSNTAEERLMKKQRFMELQESVSKAFTEDMEASKRSNVPSSSSSTPLGKHLGRVSHKR